MRKISYVVEEQFNNSTVGAYLTKEKGVSHRLITKLKRKPMGITKNGENTRTIDTIYSMDIIEILLEDTKTLEANENLNVPIIYNDDDVVVFNKPVDMPVHPSHLHQGDTLGNFFASRFENISFRPINRLDRDTSGLCVVAKNAHAAKILQQSLDKTYFAIVCGEITGSGTINQPIARVSDSIILRKVSPDGQEAITDYTTISTNKRYTLVRVKLKTGRTHQIRVHFSHIGYPLAGDNMYGGSTSDISAQALHCGEVSFVHPITNQVLEFKIDIRQDMKKLLQLD